MPVVRTLLLSMPFGAVDRPALGLSLLKAGLQRKGLACDVAYPFEHLIRLIGLADYKWLTDRLPYTAFAGDWCFTLPLYGRRPDEDWAYVTDILRDTWAMSAHDIRRILRVREATPAFLHDCLAAYDWSRYDLVGFTSTFVQNLSSLALAGMLNAVHPHLSLVFGGANWEDEMGCALFECFPFIDYVCQGEADESFPALVAALAAGERAPRIPGVLSRGAVPLRGRPVGNMDRLPVPDFSDFFTMHARAAPAEPPVLLMETSRGCWWGAKHHCTFCGLNGLGMGFRSKSPARASSELRGLTSRHEAAIVQMVDNILDMTYFDAVLPEIARDREMPVIFYETKANLSRRQVGQLVKANVLTIQPGIESLSDRVLKLMRKGTTGLRNIQLLKWCRELGVSVEWNILYGLPGETDADYAGTLELMPSLAHLQPPSGSGPVRIDRFSPYFRTPEAFGLGRPRPLPVFAHLYPFDAGTRARIACYFEVDCEATTASPETIGRLLAGIEAWKKNSGAALVVEDTGEALKITDTRPGRRAKWMLRGNDRLVYLLCDRVNSAAGVAEGLARLGAGAYDRTVVEAFLKKLVDGRLMASEDGRYLALGVYARFPSGWDSAFTHERVAAE